MTGAVYQLSNMSMEEVISATASDAVQVFLHVLIQIISMSLRVKKWSKLMLEI